MKRIAIVLSILVLIVSCSTSQADFPRFRRGHCNIVAPAFHHTPCHNVVHHAAVVTPTIVTVPEPVFIFQNVSGFPNVPQQAIQPQQYQQPFAAPQVPQVSNQPLNLSDAQLDRIAQLLHQKLTSGAVAQNTLLNAPPALGDEVQPAQQTMQMSQAQVNDLGAKCSSCHMQGTATKGGLAIFDSARQFNPTKNGQPYASPEKLYQRVAANEMPPSAATNPADRLQPDTIAFLKLATGQ